MSSHKELIDDHEDSLEQVRRMFDQYFQGFERVPPTDRRDRLKYSLIRLRGESSRWNTGDRFRLGTLHQKFMTFDRMWTRKLKEYEEGTSLRDKQRKRRAAKKAASEKDMPASVAAKAPKAAGPKPPDVDDERMKKLYNVYMQAKRRNGERSNLTLEKLSAQLRKQVPALKKKHKCDRIDFKVVLKDGKPMLKAIPK